MKSNKAKVLHSLCGVPLIHYVCETASKLDNAGIYMVVGKNADQVKAELKDKKIHFIHQTQQLGTGDAVRAAQDKFKNKNGTLLVLCADTPLISVETLENLIQTHRKTRAAATLLTTLLENPSGYGRILRDHANKIERIVEERDAKPFEKHIKEINTAIYCFDIKALYDALKKVSNQNAQREYYLTDVIAVLKSTEKIIESVTTSDPSEVLGINTRDDLARIEQQLRAAILRKLMLEGVTVIDPATAYIDRQVTIGQDTVIYPNVMIEKGTEIGQQCTIFSSAHIRNSKLADDVTVLPSTVIYDSQVGKQTRVGPFAHLRNGAVIGEKCKVGNFVEIKNSRLGNETKAGHHAYLGDSVIGNRVNIGAGTITCNFDGQKKNKTIIEDDVFIGSDSQLVAPVKISKGAYVAAGSSITEDVPPYSLAIARGRQIVKPDWVKTKPEPKKKKD